MNYSRFQKNTPPNPRPGLDAEDAQIERYNRLALCIAEYQAQEACLMKLTEEQELLVFRRLRYDREHYGGDPQGAAIGGDRGNVIDLPTFNKRLTREVFTEGSLPNDIDKLDEAIDRAANKTEQLLAEIVAMPVENSDEAILKLTFLSEHLFQSDLVEQELIKQGVDSCLAILDPESAAPGKNSR